MRHRSPIIAAVVALALGAGFYFLLWQPKNDELDETLAETAELETRRGQLNNEIARLQEIQEREVEFRAALARLEEYIPSGPAQAQAIRQFQTTADAAGVTIVSVSFSTPSVVVEAPPTGSPDTVLAEITVAMEVQGGYFQVVDFFRRLEVDVPRAVLQQSVGMSAGPDGFPVLSTTWNGTLFTVIPDPDLVGGEPSEDEPAEEDLDADVDPDEADDDDDDDDDVEEV